MSITTDRPSSTGSGPEGRDVNTPGSQPPLTVEGGGALAPDNFAQPLGATAVGAEQRNGRGKVVGAVLAVVSLAVGSIWALSSRSNQTAGEAAAQTNPAATAGAVPGTPPKPSLENTAHMSPDGPTVILRPGIVEQATFMPKSPILEKTSSNPVAFKALPASAFEISVAKYPTPEEALTAYIQMKLNFLNTGAAQTDYAYLKSGDPTGEIYKASVAAATQAAYLEAMFGTSDVAKIDAAHSTTVDGQRVSYPGTLREIQASIIARSLLGATVDESKPRYAIGQRTSSVVCKTFTPDAINCMVTANTVDNLLDTGIPTTDKIYSVREKGTDPLVDSGSYPIKLSKYKDAWRIPMLP